jgi:hypothetical protein
MINPLPMFLFRVTPCAAPIKDLEVHTQNSMSIVKLLAGERLPGLNPIPPEIIGAAIWLLSDDQTEDHSSMSWYQPGGKTLPIVPKIKNWLTETKPAGQTHAYLSKKIKHYLLLPLQKNGDLEISIEHIQPIIQKYKPTIGFSVDEAKQADRVTIININGAINSETANQLRNAGCLVQQVEDMAQLLHL